MPSFSYSSSYIPDYPQSDWMMQLSQAAAQMGEQTFQWAQQYFAHTSQITDQAVENYLTASQNAMALAKNNLDRYTQIFQPMENQLVQDANTYASQPRIQQEMGTAEAGVGQSMDASRIAAEQQLQSYGIDPSSGRYAALDRAQRTAGAAAAAGAGQQARLATENTGRALRSQAIQVGQQYPGQMVNALNSAEQGYAGAVNATLANANTGAAMRAAASPFMNTASALKYPPLGNHSQSSQSGANSGGSKGGGNSGGGGGSDNFRPGGQLPPAYGTGPVNPAFYQGANRGAGIMQTGDQNGAIPDQGADPLGTDWSQGADNGTFGQTDWNGSPMAGIDPNQQNGMNPTYDQFDPNYNSYNTPNAWGDQQSTDSQGFGSGDNSGYTGFGAGDGGYQNMSSYQDPWANSGGGGGGDFTDMSQYSSEGYADGGAIPDSPTTGGFVPQGASPSNGQQTDDIPANLNANEFVVPRDVALWKGQEFFQKLIMQSRKARMEAPAHGTPSSTPARGPARFASQQMTG